MLTCACDLRVMRADRGYWCLPEVDLGLPLTDGMTAVVTARLPQTAAADAMLTGRRYGAAEALTRGIVDHIAPEPEVLDRAVAWAAEIAPKNRAVIAAHKRILFSAAAATCGWAPEAS
jgi:enoyl-CoA hydratase/carnithine racemase